MSVKHQAYKECWQWLNNDAKGPRPAPMEGMHPLALEEWWIGYNAAVADYQVEEAKVDMWTDITVWLVKHALWASVMLGVYMTDNTYVWVGGGLLGLYALWRM